MAPYKDKVVYFWIAIATVVGFGPLVWDKFVSDPTGFVSGLSLGDTRFVLLFGLAIVPVSLSFVEFLLFQGLNSPAMANVGTLMFTAVILMWYSVETRRSRFITEEATRVDVAPAVIIYDEGLDGDLTLENVGRTVALNIKVKKFKDGLFSDEDLSFVFPSFNNFLGANKSEKIGRGSDKEAFWLVTFSSLLDPTGILKTYARTEGAYRKKFYEILDGTDWT